MTDEALIEKKLYRIETAVAEVRTLGRPELLATDVVQERFILFTLQAAIQAAIDVATHIVADQRLGEPSAARDLFTILGRRGVIDGPLAERLARMVGFRNILVHEYEDLDLEIVRHIVREDVGDLLAFASAVRNSIADGA
ncbi:MAG TPA: DUF86 domain-containing protein [Thermoanaerobaculia bacterium]|nr:DUF86 domain-containing protein [Thermoanaerobaculia bacterium]